MRVNWNYWRLWDQTRAVDNARAASVEASRSRAERDEVGRYVSRYLENGPQALPG